MAQGSPGPSAQIVFGTPFAELQHLLEVHSPPESPQETTQLLSHAVSQRPGSPSMCYPQIGTLSPAVCSSRSLSPFRSPSSYLRRSPQSRRSSHTSQVSCSRRSPQCQRSGHTAEQALEALTLATDPSQSCESDSSASTCRTVSSRSTKAPYSRRSFFRSVSGRPAFFDRDASFIQTFHPDWLSLTQVSTQHMSLPLIGLVVVLTYCVVSLLVLRLVFGWTFVDGCYFCIVMLSTVGYGDVVPMTSAEKLFVSLSAFVAVSMLAAALGWLMDFIMDHREMMRSNNSAWSVLCKAAVAMCVIMAIGAVPFAYIENVSWTDAVYWASMTMTTVGFGDVVACSHRGRLFSGFYVLFGTLFTAKILGSIMSIPVNYRHRHFEQKVLSQFDGAMDRKDYERIRQKVQSLGMTGDSPSQVSMAEFLVAMLVSMERVSDQDIRELITQFRALDRLGDGFLSESDFKSPSRHSTRGSDNANSSVGTIVWADIMSMRKGEAAVHRELS